MLESARSGRLAHIDAARGAAIACMVVYHLCWDLSFLGLWPLDVSIEPGWIAFQRLILGSFLFLVGVGLVLGHGEGIRWRAFWRRLGVIVVAALAMTVGTFLLFGEAFAFFGILHAVALFSILGLGFLRLPVMLVVAVAGAVIGAGILVHSSTFNTPWLAWIGFWTVPPRTADLVAVFPWFGVTLLGIAAARLGTKAGLRRPLETVGPRSLAVRSLALAGRWSLVIYLLHQPLLLGILYPLSMLMQPGPAQAFVAQCQPSCTETGGAEGYCAAYCDCALETIERDGLWDAINATPASPAQSQKIDDVIRLCRALAE